ncbi:MAG: hypothetical protein KJ939_01185 [Nanoarchaeota archaeon]|nr:hypothetical protein [Nanoarchaeota archaeon]MBU4351678.1 hypothetical protein [Nanoarchaeota archaeon]
METKDFIHRPKQGDLTRLEERLITYKGKEILVLRMKGYSSTFILVPGIVVESKTEVNEEGLPVSRVDRICTFLDHQEQKKLSEIILKEFNTTGYVNFV